MVPQSGADVSGFISSGFAFLGGFLGNVMSKKATVQQQLGSTSVQLDNSEATIHELETNAATVQSHDAVVLRASGSQTTTDPSAPINQDDGFKRPD